MYAKRYPLGHLRISFASALRGFPRRVLCMNLHTQKPPPRYSDCRGWICAGDPRIPLGQLTTFFSKIQLVQIYYPLSISSMIAAALLQSSS